jgi:Gas vesicle synthesis protein GvpL/GvpF
MNTATYLYCLARAPKPPALGKAPTGVPGAKKPRVIDAGDGLWLVAADAPLDRYGERPIEARLSDLDWVSSVALPHEAVVEHVSKTATVVPMKLFTLFHSDERALEHIRKQRKRLDRLLERLDGREEWGVRMILDEVAALRTARTEAAATSKAKTGAAFLLRKKKEQDAAKELLQHARTRADELFEELSTKSDDARRRPPPPGKAGERVLLDAAFLLPRRNVKTFQSAIRTQAKKLALRGYQVVLTGPWPPYNFVAESA